MSVYRAVYGTAHEVPRNDPVVDSPRVRTYRTLAGRAFIGEYTTGHDYWCSWNCLPEMRGAQAIAGGYGEVDPETGKTVDLGWPILDDWPDYSVHCATCGAFIH